MDDLAKQQIATQVAIAQRDFANNRIVDLTVELTIVQAQVKALETKIEELELSTAPQPLGVDL